MRRVLLAARNEKFKKKDSAWVFDKTGSPTPTTIASPKRTGAGSRASRLYLEHDEEFDFTLLDRTLEKDRVVFHCAFKPKSDFSEMPRGEIWVDGNGFRVVHEIYDFTQNPFPMLIKGVRRISVQWTELPDGEWVPKQIAGEIDLRRNAMPFMPASVSFKQIWQDFRFDQGYDEKLFGGKEPAAIAAAKQNVTDKQETKPAVMSPQSPNGVSAVAPPEAADSLYVFIDSTLAHCRFTWRSRRLDRLSPAHHLVPRCSRNCSRRTTRRTRPKVDIINHAFIDSTAAMHDSLGVAGLKGGPPLYGDAWRLDFDPHITDWDYNRVEGFLFGGGGSFGRADERAKLEAFGGYATASEKFRWRAKFKTELPGTNHKLAPLFRFAITSIRSGPIVLR
jgi:hypothetical protein